VGTFEARDSGISREILLLKEPLNPSRLPMKEVRTVEVAWLALEDDFRTFGAIRLSSFDLGSIPMGAGIHWMSGNPGSSDIMLLTLLYTPRQCHR
jgi:hypothetical protein